MKKTRVEISFEQREIWRVSRADKAETQICPFCLNDAPMISAEDLAALAAASPREIYRQIERGTLHFVETADKQIFVCFASFSEKILENNWRN
ncbi:MAG TPA: hypothetical protein VGC76_04380 [Pyrinomonadaceae bacterium]|jgi:hypothetical protein